MIPPLSSLTLNRLPVLDKGFVALVSTHNSGMTLQTLQVKLSTDHSFVTLARLLLAIKAPLFLQLNLSKFNLRLIQVNSSGQTTTAFIPDLTDVKASDRETSAMIAEDIAATTEALLINPKAYQQDGCDKFISQVLTPISVYNEFLVEGDLGELIKFVQQSNAPAPIAAYQKVIKDIINNEWPSLNL